ncbi:MAG: DUF4932 domain-containing protein [Oscillospiraceae bacterium]|nr:DUF4932 domain-containing protein [Oscillospiraceae bacterium]
MAIHLEKLENSYSIVDNTDYLFKELEGTARWTPENSVEFLELLNDFYLKTNFSRFFRENAEYYADHSERFANDIYNSINFQWFSQYGLNPDNIRVVVSPSSSSNGYGGWLYGESPNDTIVYAALPSATDYSGYISFVIHEFTHAIGNPIAEEWYTQNEEFKRWSDDSVDLTLMPNYSSGMVMAFEYVTRAYTLLYLYENMNGNMYQLFHSEIASGFPYIQQVFALITDHEIVEIGTEISTILGIEDYVIGDEHSFNLRGRLIKWHFIDLGDYEIMPEDYIQTEVGDLFGSQTGQVLLVTMDDSKFLYIDLGSAQHQGWSSRHRMYSVFPLH